MKEMAKRGIGIFAVILFASPLIVLAGDKLTESYHLTNYELLIMATTTFVIGLFVGKKL